MKLKRNARLSLAAAVVMIAPLVLAGEAYADYAPQPGDVVGIGGDTPQYAIDFGANGDFLGDLGYNSSNPVNRLVSFDATADANGRTGYTSTGGTLNPTDVLRAGSFPVQRNSSSGNSINALLADTASPEVINYIFSSSLPSTGNQTTAGNEGFGYLHVVEIGTDNVGIATSTSSNAPAGGLTIAQLLTIYTNNTPTSWNTLTGGSDPSTGIIIPLLPPSSSAITKALIAALTAANGGTAPTLGTNVVTVEQNDPTAITGSSSPANAIVPFSQARLNLWNGISPAYGTTSQYTNPSGGYFHNPATVFPGTATALTPGVTLISGWTSPVTDYVIFRQSDLTSTKIFEPGGTKNFVQTLFSDPGGSAPYFAKASTQALIAAAGVTPNYVDLGNVHA